MKSQEISMNFTRRTFLRTACLGAAAASLNHCSYLENSECIEGLALGESTEETCIVVVGSGFGGAITAARLTAEGFPVLLLERGRRWDISGEEDAPFCSTLSPDQRSTWLQTKTELPTGPSYPIRKYVGVLERRAFDGIDVYTGAGFGGGSLVYGGILLPARREALAHLLPEESIYDELARIYYPRVLGRLRASTMPQDIAQNDHYKYARVFREQAQKAGLPLVEVNSGFDWDIIRAELDGTIPASTIKGETISGVNSGAKNSLDTNYLASAEASGLLTTRLLTELQEITQNDDGRYALHCNIISDRGCVIGMHTVTAKHVFLAMGSVNTTTTLVRARDKGTLPGLNAQIGQNWGNNGNVHFARSFVGESTGKQQGMPIPYGCQNVPGMPIATAENAPFPIGIDTHSLLHLVTAHVESRGHFTYDSATDQIQLHYPQYGRDEATLTAQIIADQFIEANGGKIGNLMFPGFVNDFTYHPVGGVNIGEACDHAGRVFGADNLYVVDGALMPGTGGAVNPALTIAALSERCLDILLAENQFT